MPGVPGSGGPVPKRSDQRRRRNKLAVPIASAPGAPEVARPEADAEWHPIARDWYDSLARSGQSAFYEPSDWATARYVAEAMSRSLVAAKMSGQLFAAVMSASTVLLATEGDRRRLRIELERAAAKSDSPDEVVTELDAYRRRAAGAG
jgi:hypothetical protein